MTRLAIALVLFASPALANPVCFPRADLIACVLATGTEWKMTAQGVEG